MNKIFIAAGVTILLMSLSGCSESRNYWQLQKGDVVRVDMKNGEFVEMRIDNVSKNKLSGRGISIAGMPEDAVHIEVTSFWRTTVALIVGALILQLIIFAL